MRIVQDGGRRWDGGLGRAAVWEAQVAKGGREERRGLGRFRLGIVPGVRGHDTVVPPLRAAVGECLLSLLFHRFVVVLFGLFVGEYVNVASSPWSILFFTLLGC